jgi:hypothetical protein
MFAISFRPRNPEFQPGEILLLQLVKQEARRMGKIRSRVDFALVFDRLERDHDGSISRTHWPAERREWPWIIFGSATVPTIPFSLEELPLRMSYEGQDNARHIAPDDEQTILPLIQWGLAEQPKPELQLVPPTGLAERFGREATLSAIYNHDRILQLREEPAAYDVTGERYQRNPLLADSLKSYYEFRCQICGQDFRPQYDVRLADTHHIQYLSEGGRDLSTNILVVCPNHHRVIHATNARFVANLMAYEYPNGLREKLIFPDHLAQSPRFGT